VKSETIDYRDGDLTLKGFVAFDDSKAGKRPGILVNPEGFGLGPHAKSRAERLAQLGYVALAADPFGGGAIAKDLDEAMKLATPLMSDTAKLRARAHAGLHTLAAHPLVDTNRLVAIGYCMGGTFSLELARDGTPLRGIVSFHGGLQTQRPAVAGQVKAKILVCNGNDDPFVPAEHVTALINELTKAGADWQIINYGGTVHSFTNPEADSRGNPALKYNKLSDERSWKAMTSFFDEIFAG
jgi:dienelactone hydrolase